jgi:hypothetical protein
MSKLLIASLLLFILTPPTTIQLSSLEGTKMSDDLKHLNKIWNQAWLENNVPLVEKLMAEDYLYITPGGKLMDRNAILNIMKSPSYRLDNSTRTPLVIKAAGEDAAVMVFHSQASGTFEGKSFQDDHKCTMLCVRRGGEWRVLLEQCSPISL